MSSIPNAKEFIKWKNQIDQRRAVDCAKSVVQYPFASCRIRMLCGNNVFKGICDKEMEEVPMEPLPKGSVVYWMNRDQRVQGTFWICAFNFYCCDYLRAYFHALDNWALLFAQRVAMKFSVPLNVCFNLPSSSAIRTRRHVNFLLEGLTEVEQVSSSLFRRFPGHR